MLRTLINFSGGVDSTYYLWRWLNTHKGMVLVHHCEFCTARVAEERRAVHEILKHLDDSRIVLRTTVFDRVGISGNLQDIEIIYFLAGLIAKDTKAFPDLKTVLMSQCREELEGDGALLHHVQSGKPLHQFDIPGNRIATAIQTLLRVSRRALRVESPYQDLTKRQMLNELPEPIRNAVWFCHACRRIAS